MSKKLWFAVAVLAIATFSLSIYSCSDDDPAAPGGGGGGGTGTKVAAGVYDLKLSQWTCGMTDTLTIDLDEVMCKDFSFDELFEIECPATISNDAFSIDCTEMVDEGSCTYTERVQVNGTKVGDTWTVTGTITISNENPADCSGEPACANVMVEVEMISGPPSACTYADANTIESTIVGGPLAGSTVFETSGSGGGAGDIFAWNFFGSAGTDILTVQQQGVSAANFANIGVNLADIDVTALPETFTVTVGGGGVSPSALPTGSVSYSDRATDGEFFFSTSGSGSITVNEVSDTHIAGTINSLEIDGTTSPGGMSETRSISGGFHVRSGGLSKTESAYTWGLIGRMLSKR